MAKKKFKEKSPNEPKIDRFMDLGFEKHKKRDYLGELQVYSQGLAEHECIEAQLRSKIARLESELIRLPKQTAKKKDSVLSAERKYLAIELDVMRSELAALEHDKAVFYRLKVFPEISLRKFDEALEDCAAIIKLNPNDKLIYWKRGLVKYAMKDYNGALKDFNTALKYRPRDCGTLFARKMVKMELGKVASAMRDYAKEIKFGRYDKGQAYESRACGFFALRKYDKAIMDFDRVLKVYSKDPCAYYNRGHCKYLLGDISGAKEDCNRAHSLDKGLPDFKEARKIFEKC